MDTTIVREYKGQHIYIYPHLTMKGWSLTVNLDNGITWADRDTFVGTLEEVAREGARRGQQLIDNRL